MRWTYTTVTGWPPDLMRLCRRRQSVKRERQRNVRWPSRRVGRFSKSVVMMMAEMSLGRACRGRDVDAIESNSSRRDRLKVRRTNVIEKNILGIAKVLIERAIRGQENLFLFWSQTPKCGTQRVSRIEHLPLGLKRQSPVGPKLYRCAVAFKMEAGFKSHMLNIPPLTDSECHRASLSKLMPMRFGLMKCRDGFGESFAFVP